ncbi:hypothetical protein H0H92_014881 [Tricholoma furcatifolium]|nr:hypothetical protein H0H92_014881 [Tricholoma furcatifolium]
MIVSSAFILSALSLQALAFPQYGQGKGVRITAPPQEAYTGILAIPEPSHPYIAPGPNDIRGPCPGLNTLANHGYIPRNGIATYEQIVNATSHAFNMGYVLSSALTAFGMLARGNPYTNQISIGLDDPLVIPPLPGRIDGPETRGLAAHGRFEGDVSLTRQDVALGDNIHFQQSLFSQLVKVVSEYGDNSNVTGPRSIVNQESLARYRQLRYNESMQQNPVMSYPTGRMLLSYGEIGFILNLFANGTDGTLSIPAMTSIFRDQRIPPNFYRRASPGTPLIILNTANEVYALHPVTAGAKVNGKFVADPTPNNCSMYDAMAGQLVPNVLANTTGLLGENVQFLLQTVHNMFPSCPVTVPSGPANI